MFSKQKIIFFLIIPLIFIGLFFLPKIVSEMRWNIISQQARAASSGYPYVIGLKAVTVSPCVPSCCSSAGCRCCIGEMGGELCVTKPIEAECVLYTDIFGTPAGGAGTNGLYLKTQVALAGVKPGDDILSGGMSMLAMEQGVLASPQGCSGCIGKLNAKDKFVMWLSDFFIAGKKE